MSRAPSPDALRRAAAQVLIDDLGNGYARAACAQCKRKINQGAIAVPWLRAIAKTFVTLDLALCCSKRCAEHYGAFVARRESKLIATPAPERRRATAEAVSRALGVLDDDAPTHRASWQSWPDAQAIADVMKMPEVKEESAK